MPAYGVDGLDQTEVGVIFQNVTAGSCGQDFPNHALRIVHGQNQDFRSRRRFFYLPGRFNSIAKRHANIKHGNVGFELLRFFYRFASVGSLGTDFPALLGLEEGAEPSAYHRVVVSD